MIVDRAQTGNRTLDTAFAGGVPLGAALLVVGEEGAGATEFALSFLHHAIAPDGSGHGRFLSAVRSPGRVMAEFHDLFEEGDPAKGIEVRKMEPDKMRADPTKALEGLSRGDRLIIESADAIAPPGDGYSVPPFWREIADAAGEKGVVVMLLHSPGTLPSPVEAALAEAADGVMRFTWHDSGPTRRRVLSLVKLRGLAPGVDGAEVALYDVSLQRGTGISVTRGRSVL